MSSVENEAALKGRSHFPEVLSSLCNLSDQCVCFLLVLFFWFLDVLSLLHWPDFMFACSTYQPEALELLTHKSTACFGLFIKGNDCTDGDGDNEIKRTGCGRRHIWCVRE